MPYRHVVKVSPEVYSRLDELRGKLGLESANQVIAWLLDRVTPTPTEGVTPSVGTALAEYMKPYLYDRRPVVRLLVELVRGSRGFVHEQELLRQGLVARQVAESSAGTLSYEPRRGVTLSPLLRAVLEVCGCGEELARELES
jgi:hypothetical protein